MYTDLDPPIPTTSYFRLTPQTLIYLRHSDITCNNLQQERLSEIPAAVSILSPQLPYSGWIMIRFKEFGITHKSILEGLRNFVSEQTYPGLTFSILI